MNAFLRDSFHIVTVKIHIANGNIAKFNMEYSLYGFKSLEEKDLFLRLINVKGLGPKYDPCHNNAGTAKENAAVFSFKHGLKKDTQHAHIQSTE